MVSAEESQMCQQFTALNSLYLDHMALLQPEKNFSFPYFTPALMSNSAAFPGQPTSSLHGLNTEQLNADGGFFKPLPPYPILKPCSKYSQYTMPHGLRIPDMPVDASHVPQKRFLIFDKSGNHTRLFFSPSFSPQNEICTSKAPDTHCGLHDNVASQLDQQFLVKQLVEENWGENHLTDGEDELLEDSEEIDALFYSDTDDDNDEGSDTDGENDEVTSMIHTPFSNEDALNNETLLEELTEDVASTNGTQKRQKLLDGRYTIPSLLNVQCPVQRASSCTYEDDVESSCAGARKFYDDSNSSNREKKIKVRDALKTLEGIIPGLNSDDPLHIIEKAIVFLKSMRGEAEALGLDYLEHQSTTST